MILLLAVMTAVSVGMRLIPFVFSKWLTRWSFLEKLGATLPLCISLLLVAHLLENTPFKERPFAIPELAGLLVVVLTQTAFRKILLSMGLGILTHQILLHYLGNL